jgi:chromosomal replication initiation ATPase DnaA
MITEIINSISQKYQVPPGEVLSKKRKMPLPAARHNCFAACYRAGFTQQKIAELFGVSQSAISLGITQFFQTQRI